MAHPQPHFAEEAGLVQYQSVSNTTCEKTHFKLSHEAHECADSIPNSNLMVCAVQYLEYSHNAGCEDLTMKYNEEHVKRKRLFNEIQEAKVLFVLIEDVFADASPMTGSNSRFVGSNSVNEHRSPSHCCNQSSDTPGTLAKSFGTCSKPTIPSVAPLRRSTSSCSTPTLSLASRPVQSGGATLGPHKPSEALGQPSKALLNTPQLSLTATNLTEMSNNDEVTSQTIGPYSTQPNEVNPNPNSAHTQPSGSMGSLYSLDSGSLNITAHKLDGKNYLQWAQSVKLGICGRGKLGYITGDLPAPLSNDPTYKELDLYLDTTPLCANCTIIQQQQLEKERVFEFLTGLNSNLGEVRGCLVGRAPFPETEEAFYEDLSSGRMIGSARIRNELYLFERQHPVNEFSSLLCLGSSFVSNSCSNIQTFPPEQGNPTISSENPPTSPKNTEPEGHPQDQNVQKEIRVYSRRERNKQVMNPQHSQMPNPVMEPLPSKDPGILPSNKELDLDIPIALKKGTRSCTQYPISKFISYSKLSSPFKAFTSNLPNVVIPRNIEEALDSPQWKAAVLEEIRAPKHNGMWKLVELPPDKKVIGCKWVFTIKFNANGSIERYKARLVSKGFTQTYGIDYTETFALVAKLNTIKNLLSLDVNMDWELHQLDVKNTFLNGELEEEVYMSQPPGFEESLKITTVCKLKSLYGLKQSPRAWFNRFLKVVKWLGYIQGQTDHTLFVKHLGSGKIAVLIVYVDDIIITGNHIEEINSIKEMLGKEFEVKDLGALKYFLGMEFARSKKGISVS
ncbi:uncharacterized protein LOC133825558 [Humulus lupulus]|uniref:uncharacterized protein LOC133825558 n=1 Tax=Humulus lupulus TaxID=3486 RepID=UPI002B415C0B|nr:uncharacterized protein LOC133825558 [Humulus lupulus]